MKKVKMQIQVNPTSIQSGSFDVDYFGGKCLVETLWHLNKDNVLLFRQGIIDAISMAQKSDKKGQ